MNDVSTRPAAPKGELPDMGYIRDHVPVEDVMRALGIHVEGQRGRCPFVENHAHGDRTPSLSFFRNKVKCHGCNTPLESSIDYVARYKHCSATDAARWIAGQFSDVPTIAAKRQKPAGAPPTSFPLWMYDRGYIASLPPAYVVLAGALFERSEGDAVEVSYLTLRRKSGIGSDATVRAALRRFQDDGWLLQKSSPHSREKSYFTFRFGNSKFQNLLKELEVAMHTHRKQECQQRTARRAQISGRINLTPSIPETVERKPPTSIQTVPSEQILTANPTQLQTLPIPVLLPPSRLRKNSVDRYGLTIG